MADIDRVLNRVLRDFFSDYGTPAGNRVRGARTKQDTTQPQLAADWIPPVDVLETDDAYHIRVELPGLTKDALKLELSDENTLLISGEYPKPQEYEQAKPVYTGEILFGKFARAVPLPAGKFDPNKIEAKMENGVLCVRVGKSEQMKPKQISIQ